MKQLFVILLIVLCVGAGSLPSLNGQSNAAIDKKPSFEEENIFGFFPRVVGDVIIYLSLSPFGWRTIYKDYFHGSLGFIIRGTYTSFIHPQAGFIYFPLKDQLRVVGTPIFFKSLSTDLDGEIIEEWWKYDDSEPWVLTDEPCFSYTEPGYHNVSLRVIDNDLLNATCTLRLRIYERTPTFQGLQGVENITIVGYHIIGSIAVYNWSDFQNVGSGSCVIPPEGHPQIGDVITNCSGLIILQYVLNGVIAGYWNF
ncbi:MAG: hypothetical protein JW840_08315 [Candidatus Thermoplasmatota archaeon]|nr:hypothetical protein [Candidatus Thermoplasmatota archaeon]